MAYCSEGEGQTERLIAALMMMVMKTLHIPHPLPYFCVILFFIHSFHFIVISFMVNNILVEIHICSNVMVR